MPEPLFNQVLQVAVVVRSVDAAVRKYADLYGIGPWMIYEFNPETVQNMIIMDEPVNYAMRLALADIGGVQWELIEPKDDTSIYAAFLREHGEGLHHVAFGVKDYNGAVERLRKMGHKVLQGGTWHDFTYTYVTTFNDLGVIAELYNPPPDFQWPAPDDVYPKAAK
jgi:methylmalonyl-CoA/ethylmalonyl-CoA epimerase